MAKKKPALKHDGFHLWKTIMDWHLLEHVNAIDLNDVLVDTLIQLLEDNHRIWEAHGEFEGWHDGLGMVVGILGYYQRMNEFNVEFGKFNSKGLLKGYDHSSRGSYEGYSQG